MDDAAVDADSKLMINWHVSSRRNKGEAIGFLSGVAYRLLNRIQLTTDGLGAYNGAIRQNFGDDIVFAHLLPQDIVATSKHRPGVEDDVRVFGVADALDCLLQLFSLNGKTPAMAAGLTDRAWRIEDLVTNTLCAV